MSQPPGLHFCRSKAGDQRFQWLTSLVASPSSCLTLANCPSWHLQMSSTCSYLHTRTHKHTLFTAHLLLTCSLSFFCRQISSGRVSHPAVSPWSMLPYTSVHTHLRATASIGNLLKSSSRTEEKESSRNTRDKPKQEKNRTHFIASSLSLEYMHTVVQ